jgi:serine/threonine protein kinase
MTGETGSYRYMAPEVFRHEEYTETVDIYSFAMIFYYLILGRAPWEALSGLDAVTKAAVLADRPIINRSWDAQISSLMQRCWDENPTGRPSFSVILKELNDYSSESKIWVCLILFVPEPIVNSHS